LNIKNRADGLVQAHEIRVGADVHHTCHLIRIVDQLSEEALYSIKYLAIDYCVLEEMYPGEPDFDSLLRFRNLEKVIAIFPTSRGNNEQISNDLLNKSYRFKPYESARGILERDIQFASMAPTLAEHPVLEMLRSRIQKLAAIEHDECAPTCSHSDKWKVPEVDMALKIPLKPLTEKNLKAFKRGLGIEEEKGPYGRLMKKFWSKVVGVCTGIFGRSSS